MKLWVFALLILLAGTVIVAQETDTSSVNLEQIFTDNVTIIEELPITPEAVVNTSRNCGTYGDNDTEWLIVSENERYILCNRQTNEHSEQLNIITDDCILRQLPSVSSDGRWVLFRNCFSNGNFFSASSLTLLAYDTQTEQIHRIGDTAFIQYGAWHQVDEDTALFISFIDSLLYAANQSELSNYVYLIDLNEMPSMQRIVEAPTPQIKYFPDLEVLVWLETNDELSTLYEMGLDDMIPTPLMSFVCEQIFCEIEAFDAMIEIRGFSSSELAQTQFLLIDGNTFETIHETVGWEACRVGNRLYFDVESQDTVQRATLTVLELDTLQVSEIAETGGLYCGHISPDGQFILFSDFSGLAPADYQIYDANSHTVINLTNTLPADWRIDYEWSEDDTLIATVLLRTSSYDNEVIHRVHIRLNG